MTRYDNFVVVHDPVDRDKVYSAIGQVIGYAFDVVSNILSNMNVTVEDGRVFFYSRKTAEKRYFVEVNTSTRTVKIILAGEDGIPTQKELKPCHDLHESGRKENATLQ